MSTTLLTNSTTFSHGWGFHPWFFFGFLFWLVPAIVLGIAVIFIAKWLSGSGRRENNPSDGNSAVRILQERYAKGEITKEQFEQMKKDLQ